MGEWITDRAGLWIERALCNTVRQRRVREFKPSCFTEAGENIVGPHGRGSVTYDQVKYRTVWVFWVIGARREADDRGAAIEFTKTFLRHTLNFHGFGRKKLPRRGTHCPEIYPPQVQLPMARFKQVCECSGCRHHDVHDVEAGRQRGVKLRLDPKGLDLTVETYFKIFGFTCRAGRRSAGIRDFGVRRKA